MVPEERPLQLNRAPDETQLESGDRLVSPDEIRAAGAIAVNLPELTGVAEPKVEIHKRVYRPRPDWRGALDPIMEHTLATMPSLMEKLSKGQAK
ncbi:MAG: hypothetical protein ACREGC_02555 [Minisyncoccia bacterium]